MHSKIHVESEEDASYFYLEYHLHQGMFQQRTRISVQSTFQNKMKQTITDGDFTSSVQMHVQY